MDCYCDYDPADLYRKSVQSARKTYQCNECGITINPGNSYERVFAIWGGKVETYFTCRLCLNLRLWVSAHVPCMCWYHDTMRENAIETAEYYSNEAPGLLFGTLRREVLIRRGQINAQKTKKQNNQIQ